MDYNSKVELTTRVLSTTDYSAISDFFLKHGGRVHEIAPSHHNHGLDLLKTALLICLSVNGQHSPRTTHVIQKAGEAWEQEGDLKKSLACHEAVLRNRVLLFDHTSMQTEAAYKQVAETYTKMGNIKRTIIYLKEALRTRQALLGSSHLSMGEAHFELAETFVQMEDFHQAWQHAHQTLNILIRSLGTTYVDAIDCIQFIGELECRLGWYQAALSTYQGLLQTELRRTGVSSLAAANAHYQVAEVCIYLKDTLQAEEAAKTAMKTFEWHHRTNSSADHDISNRLIWSYFQLGRIMILHQDNKGARFYLHKALHLQVKYGVDSKIAQPLLGSLH